MTLARSVWIIYVRTSRRGYPMIVAELSAAEGCGGAGRVGGGDVDLRVDASAVRRAWVSSCSGLISLPLARIS